MAKTRKPFILVIGLLTIISIIFFVYQSQYQKSTEQELSPDQQKVVELLGHPDQFSISYIENDNSQLVRTEVWLYQNSDQRITFLKGALISSEIYKSSDKYSSTPLHPEDFYFDQDFKDIEKIVGRDKLFEIKDFPGISDSNDIKVYGSNEIVFVIENGYLTYIQTLVMKGTGQ